MITTAGDQSYGETRRRFMVACFFIIGVQSSVETFPANAFLATSSFAEKKRLLLYL